MYELDQTSTWSSLPSTLTIQMHVLIVGGGLGGLSLAQCLRQQGISFEVFERDTSPDSRFQGWAIAIHTYEALGLGWEWKLC